MVRHQFHLRIESDLYMFKRLKRHIGQIRREYYEVTKSGARGVIDTLILILDFAVMLVVSLSAVQYLNKDGGWLTIVDGKSMYPTLNSSQIMFADKSEIKRGDIITINAYNYSKDYSKQKSFIKRVVGMPGDRIVIKDNRVIINGEVYDEPYLTNEAKTKTMTEIKYDSVKLDENEYFIMGDNRGNSYDSRHFGAIKFNEIINKQSTKLTKYAKQKFIAVFGILVGDIILFALVEFILKECAYFIIVSSKSNKNKSSFDKTIQINQNISQNNKNNFTTSETVTLEGDKK